MTYNTNFTLKPITSFIDIYTERKLIGSWLTAGLSGAQVYKMLLIYLGDSAWMNTDGMYPCMNFGAMAKGYKFRSTDEFAHCLLRCSGFGFVWKNEQKPHDIANLLYFFTPIWHHPKEGENYAQNSPKEQVQSCTCNNTSYSFKKKNKRRRSISSYCECNVAPDKTGNFTPPIEPEKRKQLEACIDNFLAYLRDNNEAYQNIIITLNLKTASMMPELNVSDSQPHPLNPATQRFVNFYLKQYLATRYDKVLGYKNNQQRCFWIQNLIKLKFMQDLIKRAVDDVRAENGKETARLRRLNRCISPHEYQDSKSGQRFYDLVDAQGNTHQVRIPAMAPPRPSAEAKWDKFTKTWN